MKGFLTTKQAAERLGVTDSRIRQMIQEGTIAAEKVGRDNLISEKEITRIEGVERPRGRPRLGSSNKK